MSDLATITHLPMAGLSRIKMATSSITKGNLILVDILHGLRTILIIFSVIRQVLKKRIPNEKEDSNDEAISPNGSSCDQQAS